MSRRSGRTVVGGIAAEVGAGVVGGVQRDVASVVDVVGVAVVIGVVVAVEHDAEGTQPSFGNDTSGEEVDAVGGGVGSGCGYVRNNTRNHSSKYRTNSNGGCKGVEHNEWGMTSEEEDDKDEATDDVSPPPTTWEEGRLVDIAVVEGGHPNLLVMGREGKERERSVGYTEDTDEPVDESHPSTSPERQK